MKTDQELIKITEDLIRFKTTKDKPEELKKCINYVKDFFSDCDVIIKEFMKNGKPSLFISYTETKKPKLLLNGHIDVVEADEEQFTPEVKEDKLFGRGSIDMKGGVAASMLLMKEFSKKEKKPDMALMIVGDEEIGGMDGTNYLVENGYGGEFCIAAEPSHPKNVEALTICAKEKGVLWIKIKTKGKACHGSRPWLGENAIDKIIFAYLEIKKLFEDGKDLVIYKNIKDLDEKIKYYFVYYCYYY